MRQKSNLLAAIKTALTPQKPKRNTPLATPATASTPAPAPQAPIVASTPAPQAVTPAAPAVKMTAQEVYATADARFMALAGGQSLAQAAAAHKAKSHAALPRLAVASAKVSIPSVQPAKTAAVSAQKPAPARAANPLAPTATWPEKFAHALASAGWIANVSDPVAVYLQNGAKRMNVQAIAYGLRDWLKSQSYFPADAAFEKLAASIVVDVVSVLPKSSGLLS